MHKNQQYENVVSSNTQTNLCYISIGLSFQTVLLGLIKQKLKFNIKKFC